MGGRRLLGAMAAAACLGVATGAASAHPVDIRVRALGFPVKVVEEDSGSGIPAPQPPSDPNHCLAPVAPATGGALRHLPWPVVLDTACGSFAVFRDGLVARGDFDPWLAPDPGYRVPAGTNAWAQVQQRHVVFVKDSRIVWRSTDVYDPEQLGGAVLGPGWAAFAEYVPGVDVVRAYFAPLGGRERVVALNEEPLVATPWGGLVLSRWDRDNEVDLVTRRRNGSFARIAARGAENLVPEPGGTILYRDRIRLMRTDGLRSRVVADISWLGNQAFVGITALQDGRLVLTGLDRMMILDRSGGLVSSTAVARIPRHGWGYLGVQTVEPATGAVIFTATHWADENAGGGPGWEGVYRLASGEGRAQLLFGRRLDIAMCAHSAQFSWRGRWLLYSACEGRVVAIDTAGRHAPIVLTSLVRTIPIPESEREYGLYGARWAPIASPSQLPRMTHLG